MKHAMTIEELEEMRSKDPQFQAMLADKERQRAALEAMYEQEEKPLIVALSAADWPPAIPQLGKSRSVWDLVNTAESYPTLLNILAEHVVKPYHFRIREGIVRALAVKEARGTPIARILTNELKKLSSPKDAHEDGYRWAIINTLVTIGDSTLIDDVREMLGNPDFKSVHSDLQRLAKKLMRGKRR